MPSALVWSSGLLAVFIVSLVSLISISMLSLSETLLKRIVYYLMSFAAGGLLGDAFIHLLPEAAEEYGFTLQISLSVLAGILISFLVEKYIHWRHCHYFNEASHPHRFAMMNLWGDGVHNFIDGLIIGGSFLTSIPLGISTTIAIVLHEIPQEIGDFGILIYSGIKRGRALFLNFITSLSAFLGVIVALTLTSRIDNLTQFLVPFAAGSFIYISCSDLIPELHKEERTGRSLLQFLVFLGGISVMSLLLLLE